MLSLKVIQRDGTEQAIEGEVGHSVMEIVRDANIDEMLAICGGCRSCATCHVYVHPDFVGKISPMEEDEDELLDSSDHRRENSRLSCQLVFSEALDGLTVTIAPDD